MTARHPVAAHLPPDVCGREHLPGMLCLQADGHPEADGVGRHDVTFEDTSMEPSGEQALLSSAVPASGLDAFAATMMVPDSQGEHRAFPVLILRFQSPVGTLRPVALVLDRLGMESAWRLVRTAARAAIREAT